MIPILEQHNPEAQIGVLEFAGDDVIMRFVPSKEPTQEMLLSSFNVGLEVIDSFDQGGTTYIRKARFRELSIDPTSTMVVPFSALPTVRQLDYALLTRGKSAQEVEMVQRGIKPEEYISEETLTFIIDFIRRRALDSIIAPAPNPPKSQYNRPSSKRVLSAMLLEIDGEVLAGGRFLQALTYSADILAVIQANPNKAIPILETKLFAALDNAILETARIIHKDPL